MDVFDYIENEAARQERNIELIASENFVSENVKRAVASCLTNKYAEGYPSKDFMDLVLAVKPAQVTLVPDSPDQITSNHGWDTVANQDFLCDISTALREAGIRASIFVDASPEMVELAAKAGADRVELYTEPYAGNYLSQGPETAVAPFLAAALTARNCGLGLNAGHDLSLVNLAFLKKTIPWLDEVSIGHALICDALYLGLEKTISEYKKCIL